ncbi:MAG: UPF0175 family protein [Candidatus Schekmanbacteria bacterium]|nr:UPF0175 family protein [Candidatus Schekmanbacteria bacterium]
MAKEYVFKLKIPDETFNRKFKEEEFTARVRERVVMDLLRDRKISQGKAAELLVISRSELVDLMTKYNIPAFVAASDELKEGLKNLKSALGGK